MSAWSTNKLGKTFSWNWGWTKRKSNAMSCNYPAGSNSGWPLRVRSFQEAPVILADEPTGNLDEQTAGDIIAILKKLAKERQKCVIVVTHSKEVAEASDVVLELSRRSLVEKSK